MPGDILHHDDGVIHQDADREDQREQADPVDRVAHQLRRQHRQQDCRGYHHQGDERLAQADGEADQHHNGDRGES